jgi:anti-sigma B factor antagonist
LSEQGSTQFNGYPELTVVRQKSDLAVVVIVSGEIDMDTAAQLARELTAARRETQLPLIIDMSGVTFLGSSGLSVLAQQMVDAGSMIELRDLRPMVRRVLQISGMLDLFKVTESPRASAVSKN